MKFKTAKSQSGLYFITSVITAHKCIFTTEALALIPLSSLAWLRMKRQLKLYCFCLMPNHIHYILEAIRPYTVEKLAALFNSFTAHEILMSLRKKGNEGLLSYFHNAARSYQDRNHPVWSDTLVKVVETRTALIEMLDYVHSNPVRKRWQLVHDRASYPYSSACFYDEDKAPIIPVDDIRELL